jgi:outer membrane protein assembly factor BamB
VRSLLVAAALVVLCLGIAAAYVLYRQAEGSGDVLGSSTVEFVTTEPIVHAKPQVGIRWPMFGYAAERVHSIPSRKVRPPYRREWVAGGASLLEFPPSIAYGRLFLANAAGQVLALSTKTGARAWMFATKRCVAASPAVGGYQYGTVYAVFLNHHPCNKKPNADGLVVALAAGTGDVRWRRKIGASETSPLLADNRLYVGDWLGKVYALDARTGAVEWSFKAGGAIKGGAALTGNRLFVPSYDGHLYSFDARSGRLRWRASGDHRLFRHGRFYSTPAVAYGRVYVGSTDGKVYSFGAASGKRRWSHQTGRYVYGSPAIWRGRVLIGSYDKNFYALDAATGAVRWKFRANGPISGSATVIGRIVYFATLKGRTYGLDAATGRLRWSFPDGRYSPVVADDRRLYLVGYARAYGFRPR